MLERVITGSAAWPEAAITPKDWLVRLTPQAEAEIEAASAHLKRNPLPTPALRLEDYDLPYCRAMMERIRHILDEGARFAIIDRLPVDSIGEESAAQIYWLLSSMIAPPVAQTLDGKLLFDVVDTGLVASPGSGIRPAQTNAEQSIHNDNAFNNLLPEYVGLLCLRPAVTGGLSKFVSFYTVHNILLAQHRELLTRLYDDFPHDRQREHLPSDDAILWAPIFLYSDRRLHARFTPHQIKSGYQVLGKDMDAATSEALETMRSVCNSRDIAITFQMERGHIQFVNNHEIGHSRSAFADSDVVEKRRHLVRLWMRQDGARNYRGELYFSSRQNAEADDS